MRKITREAYAEMYGPTVGDRIRLGDTDLWIEVEDDKTTYGEEVKFGGGKVIREGMGQAALGLPDSLHPEPGCKLHALQCWGIRDRR